MLYRVVKIAKACSNSNFICRSPDAFSCVFDKLLCIPFNQQCNIDKCLIFYKRINGILPSYLNEHLVINNKIHCRNNRYVNLNAICLKYERNRGGRTFSVLNTRLWNKIPISIRKVESLICFKNNMWSKILKNEQFLHHFNV